MLARGVTETLHASGCTFLAGLLPGGHASRPVEASATSGCFSPQTPCRVLSSPRPRTPSHTKAAGLCLTPLSSRCGVDACGSRVATMTAPAHRGQRRTAPCQGPVLMSIHLRGTDAAASNCEPRQSLHCPALAGPQGGAGPQRRRPGARPQRRRQDQLHAHHAPARLPPPTGGQSMLLLGGLVASQHDSNQAGLP